jgi:hypothetical protein
VYVGSGKTIVTLFAMLLAVENGFQAALMHQPRFLQNTLPKYLNIAGRPGNTNNPAQRGSYKGKPHRRK